MGKRKESEVILNSFDQLAEHMKDRGIQMPEEVTENVDQFEQLFDNDKTPNKEASFEIEKKAENIIKEAEEVMDDVSGPPKDAEGNVHEPSEEIEIVSANEKEDTGTISSQDLKERRDDLIEIANEENKLDEELVELKDAGAKPETIDRVKNIKSFLLGEADKIIREMSPELFALINKEDYEAIKKVEDLFGTLKAKRNVPVSFENRKTKNIKINKTDRIKAEELFRGRKITEDEYNLYREAEDRRSAFARQAEQEGIPKDVARAIYRTHIDFVNELRDSEPGEHILNKSEIIPSPSNIDEGVIEVPSPESQEEGLSVSDSPIENIEAESSAEIDGEHIEDTVTETKSHHLEKRLNPITLNEAQSENYKELTGLYESCTNRVDNIKDEKEKVELSNYLSNLGDHIEKIQYKKGKDADDTLIILKSITRDVVKKINYLLESQEPAVSINEELNAEIIETREESGTDNGQSEIIKNEAAADNNILTEIPEEHKKYVPAPEAPSDFEKVVEVAEAKIQKIAKESKEKNLSDFEKKLEVLRSTIFRCVELAETIKNTDTRNNITFALNQLISDVENIYDKKDIDDKEKSTHIYNSLKKLLLDIDNAHKPESKNKIENKGNSNQADQAKQEEESKNVQNRIENKVERKRPPQNISEKVRIAFEEVGVGMDSLKEIDGFQSLSAGQQLLMLKNYNSVLFDKMNADTKKEANAEWTKKTTVGKLGRLGLSIVTLGTAKTFREKRKQKEVAGRLLAKGWLGFEDKQALLQSLVSVAEESPEVFVDREGDLQIEYVDSKRYDSNPDAYDIIKSYNEAASAYAAVPHSWIDNNISSNGEAENNNFFSKLLGQKHTFLSGKERSAMSDVKEEYNSARENFMNLMLETSGDTIENRRFAMKELNQLDERVKMNQIFTSDPNAENLLQESRDASVFNQAMSEFISKRGQYMAYGSLARIAAVATVTSIAAPVGLAIIGGMSYLRGKREVRDMLKMKRVSGAISEKDLNEEMVYTVDLHESLNNLNFAMEQAEANNDRDEGFRLRDRIAHVNKQIESGHNFEKRTRKLGEFRDAKFYSDRVENLISKYEMLKGVPGQERDAEVVELKIAQTATLMRELMNNNMLRFGGREDDSISPKNRKESKSVINRLAFIQALSLADTTISLDTNGIEKKVAEIVGKKRETINTVDENKAIKHCREAVAIGVVFGGVGYALTHFASGFFGHGAHHSGGGHVDSADKPTDGSLNLRARAPSIPKAEPQDIRGAGDGKSFIDSVKEGGENILEKIGIGNSHEALAEGMYRAHEGESLSSIIVSHNEKLLELSPNARDNAINNFLNHLTGSQLKEIGLTSPHKIVSGQTINIAKLEDYFDNMRVGGRTFAERAMQVTGEAPEKIQSIIEETPNNLSEVNPHQTYQELHRASLETIKARDAAAEAFINKATEVELKPLTYENTAQFESAFPSLTPAEVVASWDNIIPQYIAKHIGSNNYDLLASADNVKAGDLSGFMGHHANIIGGDPKSQMLKSVAEALEKHGITPDEGFDFNDAMVRNQNLKDFVEQSYRAMIMTSGIASIQ